MVKQSALIRISLKMFYKEMYRINNNYPGTGFYKYNF